ncbi:MAG: hypothetical protein SNH56_02405 [Rikenellaceae bacterium]
MNNQTNIERFDNELRRAIGGAEYVPSLDLWSRIEQSAVSLAPYSAPLPAARWAIVAAAAVLVAVGLGVWFSPVETMPAEPLYAAYIEEFIEVGESRTIAQAHGIEHIQEPIKRIVTPSMQSQPAPETPAVVQEPEAQPVPDSTSHVETQEQPQQPRYHPQSHPQSQQQTKRSPIKLSLMVAGGSTSSSSINGAKAYVGDFMPNGYTNLISNERYTPTEVTHHVPVSYAISVTAPLGGRWSLESGISYSSLFSDVTMPYSSQSVSQRLQFVGVPLRLKYDLYSCSNISLYGGAGGELERCISATLNSQSIDEKPWHTSLNGSLGVQYNLTRRFALYAEPEVSYYLTETELTTIRSDSPISLSGRVGLRVIF